MKSRKVLTVSAIILSILAVLMDAGICLRMNSFLRTQAEDTYERMGSLMVGAFLFGAFVWGLGLLLAVWVEYFLIIGIIKLCKKPRGIGKYLAISVLSLIAAALLIAFVAVFVFLVVILLK